MADLFLASDITLDDVSCEANNWLINYALPLWYENGVDWDRGGFHENLNADSLSCNVQFKRLRVLSRQIYVFSAGFKMDQTYCKKAVLHGLDFLFDKARKPSRGFANRFSLTGKVIDDNLVLYDLAFCLFGLAHAYKILGDKLLLNEAIYLTDFISECFRHPSGGFFESIPRSFPRQQNPHMHFLEALIEWRKISDHSIFDEVSNEIVDLFFNKFYFRDSGILHEYFDENLLPLNSTLGDVIEPGHHFEWIWLLGQYKKISKSNIPDFTSLYKFAEEKGLCPSNGMLLGAVSKTGNIINSNVRIWPHTEWLKAELTNYQKNNNCDRVVISWKTLRRFLDYPQLGLWYETFDHADTKFIDGPVPASSFYHIVLAIEALNMCKENKFI